MEDYVDILLRHLIQQKPACPDHESFLRQKQVLRCTEALSSVLSNTQWALFLSYEKAANDLAFFSEIALARKAFLLAREIYR